MCILRTQFRLLHACIERVLSARSNYETVPFLKMVVACKSLDIKKNHNQIITIMIMIAITIIITIMIMITKIIMSEEEEANF